MTKPNQSVDRTAHPERVRRPVTLDVGLNMRFSIILIATLFGIMWMCGCATNQSPRTYVTTESIDGIETATVYHAVSKEYRFADKGLSSGDTYLGLSTILYEVTTRTEWHEGMDGVRSHVQVVASIVDKHGRVQKRMWAIEHDGHEFRQSHAHDPKVYILKRGCCDAPDQLTAFDATSGKFIESHECRRIAEDVTKAQPAAGDYRLEDKAKSQR
jgi:hypothetical protein